MVRVCGGVDCAAGDARSDTNPAYLTADPTDKRRIIGRVHGGEIGNLHGNDVVEDPESPMDS